MANELTITASLSFFKSTVMNQAISEAVSGLLFNVSGSYYIQGQLSVATSATVIPLGTVTAPHWSYFKNIDSTNFLRLMNGSGGAKVVKLKAGECAFFPWDDGATPYAIADSAACVLEYLIISL